MLMTIERSAEPAGGICGESGRGVAAVVLVLDGRVETWRNYAPADEGLVAAWACRALVGRRRYARLLHSDLAALRDA